MYRKASQTTSSVPSGMRHCAWCDRPGTTCSGHPDLGIREPECDGRLALRVASNICSVYLCSSPFRAVRQKFILTVEVVSEIRTKDPLPTYLKRVMPHPELLRFTPAISLALCGSGIYGLLTPVRGMCRHDFRLQLTTNSCPLQPPRCLASLPQVPKKRPTTDLWQVAIWAWASR